MKLTWQTSLAGIACVGLLGLGAWLPGQDRTGPERTVPERNGPERAPRVAKQLGDVVMANDCHANIFDKVTIPAARGGVLGSVKYEVGQVVKAGEEVAKVKDEVAKAQFTTADTTAKNDVEIKFAEKSAEVAQVEYMKALRANAVLPNTVTDIEVLRLKLNLEKGLLQKQNAEKDHEVNGCKRDEAGEVLLTHVVQTPMHGLVTKLYKRTGDGVREGEAIMDVVNTDLMRVSGYVPLRDRSRVQIGDLVRVKIVVEGDDLPEENLIFEGKITFIDPAVQKVKPEVRVFAEVANRDGVLCDGLTCSMAIYPGKSQTPTATSQRSVPKKVVAGE
ncbi:MAG: czcB 4 [Planctomycetaceae bacterium]|nr:czcB 4 [Planctomycetaceae bacterium]